MPLPRIAPMKAVTGELPTGDGWAAEVKVDGMRVVAAVGDPDRPLRLDTTRGLDARSRFPELAGLAAALAPRRVILDGEVAAFDADGRPSFSLLQRRMHLTRGSDIAQVAAEVPVRYVIFDLLWIDGVDVTGRRYLERRELLGQVVEPGRGWLVPAHHIGAAEDLFNAAQAKGLEGIVAKRVDSVYVPGSRSPWWRKVKARPRQEFVIGGWQPGEGGRSGQLGSLLVGVYQDDELRYAGKVGTGFTDSELARLGGLLAGVASDECPFQPAPPPAVVRLARWVQPVLVAEVAFAEWTTGATLRHPSYIGIRTDKAPRHIVREA